MGIGMSNKEERKRRIFLSRGEKGEHTVRIWVNILTGDGS